MSISVEALEQELLNILNSNDPRRAPKMVALCREFVELYPDASALPYLNLAYFAHRNRLHAESLYFVKQAILAEPFNAQAQRLHKQLQNSN